MARDDPQFRIRLPPEMKARIEEEAHKAGRSLNAEIVHRLGLTLGDGSVTPVSSEGNAQTVGDFVARMWTEKVIAEIDALREDIKKSLREEYKR